MSEIYYFRFGESFKEIQFLIGKFQHFSRENLTLI